MKGAIALTVILGSFALIGVYVVRGQVPDATVVGMLSLPVGAVLGFYFGHINGSATALAQAATSLAISAQATVEKRVPLPAGATPPPIVVPPAVVVPPPPPGGSSSGT